MSRSRRKNPVLSDYSRGKTGTKLSKRIASKVIRKYKGYIPNGTHYKKLYCSWNIFDYKSFVWDDPAAYRK